MHVEVEVSSGFPVVGDVAEESGDQAQERGGIGKDANHASAAFELLVDAFGEIGGAEADAMWWREREDGEAFWDVVFEPGGEFGSGLVIFGDHGLEERFGLRARLGLEDFL